MKHLWLTAKLDIVESLRARWFLIYSIVFGGIVALLFAFGLTESRVLGFIGLSRLLVTYIQLAMAILPIFVLITTVRSVAGDREAGVFEYLLSLPVGLAAWFWGKIIGRYVTIFLPVFVAMLGAALWALVQGIEVPWGMFIYYTGLLAAMGWCFLGIGMLISTLARADCCASTMPSVDCLLRVLVVMTTMMADTTRANTTRVIISSTSEKPATRRFMTIS